MKPTQKEKYQIAWFKLSEFIHRHEKERALGIYKLLMHTIDDPAFAKQLEGDLLLFFEKPEALDKYVEAAELYKKQNKLPQATAIYEHLVMLAPENSQFISHLSHVYEQLNHPTRLFFSLERLIEPIVSAHNEKALQKLFEHVMPLLPLEDQATLYKKTVTTLITIDRHNAESILMFIQGALESLEQSPSLLKNFINDLGKLDKDYQQEALTLTKKTMS